MCNYFYCYCAFVTFKQFSYTLNCYLVIVSIIFVTIVILLFLLILLLLFYLYYYFYYSIIIVIIIVSISISIIIISSNSSIISSSINEEWLVFKWISVKFLPYIKQKVHGDGCYCQYV